MNEYYPIYGVDVQSWGEPATPPPPFFKMSLSLRPVPLAEHK